MIEPIKLNTSLSNDKEFICHGLDSIVRKINELIAVSNKQEKKIDFIMENTERDVVNDNAHFCRTLKDLYKEDNNLE